MPGPQGPAGTAKAVVRFGYYDCTDAAQRNGGTCPLSVDATATTPGATVTRVHDAYGNTWDCIAGVVGATSYIGASSAASTDIDHVIVRTSDVLYASDLYPSSSSLAIVGCPASTVLYVFEPPSVIADQQEMEVWTVWFE